MYRTDVKEVLKQLDDSRFIVKVNWRIVRADLSFLVV